MGEEDRSRQEEEEDDLLMKPTLDLTPTLTPKELPDEIPDPLDEHRLREEAGVNAVLKHADETRMEPLLKEVEVYLAIGDLEGAKRSYHELYATYTKIAPAARKEYYRAVHRAYKDIKSYMGFWSRLKRAFRKKPKERM